MLKMIDVLDKNLVQNFIDSLSAQTEHLDEFTQGILTASNQEFDYVMSHFFERHDAKEIASALDINQDQLHAIQTGLAMQQEYIADTAKIVALCLALETNLLEDIEIADCLEDYLI